MKLTEIVSLPWKKMRKVRVTDDTDKGRENFGQVADGSAASFIFDEAVIIILFFSEVTVQVRIQFKY